VPIGYAEVGTRWLELSEQELRLPLWDANEFRVAVLADVHVNSPEETRFACSAARLAMEQKPDAILIPGDYVNFSEAPWLGYVKTFLNEFREAKCPVVGTLGNHDYWTKQPHRIIECFRGSPVRLLRNEVVEVDGVSIAGIDDALANLHRPDVISDAPRSKSLITLLHEPDFVDEVPGHVSLQVSGHSHGGQICLPFGVSLHTPRGARRYIDGFYPDAHVPLFVTRGVGTTGPRYRLFCRPQVAVLTLREA
jgi:predicted MPP superfamily phosphohydrolase